MQLLSTETHYFIKSVRRILRCTRSSAQFSIVQHSELADLADVQVLGDVYGLFGKVRCEGSSHLLVITDCDEVASVRSTPVYRIRRICALPLVEGDFPLRTLEATSSSGQMNLDGVVDPSRLTSKLKSRPRKLMKFMSDKVKDAGQPMRLIDELLRLVNSSGNFYFAKGMDLTLSVQRRCTDPAVSDRNFFWNRGLLCDFFADSDNDDDAATAGSVKEGFGEWVLPAIYGYVEQKSISFDSAAADIAATLTIISRRSTRRAGVRYLRRGVDENGNVANFVETEFIMSAFGHCLSFVQIRGSVPVYWTQSGYQFRPPITMDRHIDESMPHFRKHFDHLKERYQTPLVIVNLLDQTGRELSLSESYHHHVAKLDSQEAVFYHAFDFHRHYSAVGFTAVNEFVASLQKQIRTIGFCWVDRTGQMVKQQRGVIRTNCADCLDRTNVVQSTISQSVCFTQAQKLGLVEPIEEAPPRDFLHLIQAMWTTNGDSISRQYAGTNALKRDMIRDGGQRKLVGVMKDGYNSASRYYLSQVRDAQRQRVIDTLVAGADENLGGDPLSQLPPTGETMPTAVFYSGEEEEEVEEGEAVEEGEDLLGDLMEL